MQVRTIVDISTRIHWTTKDALVLGCQGWMKDAMLDAFPGTRPKLLRRERNFLPGIFDAIKITMSIAFYKVCICLPNEQHQKHSNHNWWCLHILPSLFMFWFSYFGYKIAPPMGEYLYTHTHTVGHELSDITCTYLMALISLINFFFSTRTLFLNV